MSDITIPPEAIEAVARVLCFEELGYSYDEVYESAKIQFLDRARAACRAMLENWPGMHTGWQCVGCGEDKQIILPLHQEPHE